MSDLTAFHRSTALVTGASGFIGSALCRRLSEAGAHVHGVSRVQRSGGHCSKWWRSDLSQLEEVRAIVSAVRPDFVFHLASHVAGARPLELVAPTFASNLASAVNLLIATTETKVVRIALSGSLEEPESNGEAPVPSSPYAAAKFAASAYARMFQSLYGTPAVILRVFMVYGPGQRDLHKLIPYTIISLLAGRSPEVTSGRRLVDWVYVDDVVGAYLASALAPSSPGQTLEIGTGRLTSVEDVVRTLASLIDPSIEPSFGAVAERPYEQIRVGQIERTASTIGWQPTTELREGLERTIAWFREELRSGRLRDTAI